MKGSTRPSTLLVLASIIAIVALLLSPTSELVEGRKHKNKHNKKKRVQTEAVARGWQLTFKDEFDGKVLNEARWTTQFPWGRDRSSVGELQYYAPDAFSLKNGKLRITATTGSSSGSHAYSSGLISTHNSFTQEYGRFEIRCKVPSGKGLWPAFWLLPTDTSWPPEIDVFEALGDQTSTVTMNVHYLVDGVHQQNGNTYSGPDFAAGFHVFAVEWGPKEIIWFIDGVERHRASASTPRGPMYLLANLAVGGNWPGSPDANTPFPSTFEIDYIRAYQRKGR